jgi:hypothetical protein
MVEDSDEDTVLMTVRVKKALHRQIKEAARSAYRHVNGEVNHRLQASFERQQPRRPDSAAAA